ncbi:protein kinase [Streptomyces sp. NPDC005795]|uniref:protein kinase domain-containing protein n=1 Tax=Streptomyces sp. NPDC005795 TaxID=3154677 RepID=UPI0033D5A04B
MTGATGPIRTGVTLGGGRYRVGQKLGEGGMAVVHQAHDTALDRMVAVKSMLAGLSHDEHLRTRFRREAQAAARLSHPCVVAVHDTGEERFGDGPVVPYLVMEFVRGETLSELLRREAGAGGGLPQDRALAWAADVLSALAVSHAAGIVHRDIKPSNVMVSDAGAVKVMDFGIARSLDTSGPGRTALTATGSTPGTPQYMSPEQFEGAGAIDGRSDLYAVGVVLFQLITGRLPFDGGSAVSIGYRHATMAAPTLASAGARVSDAVEALVARALEKAPADRFQDAREMRAAIEEVRRAAPHPPTRPDGVRRADGPPDPADTPPLGFPALLTMDAHPAPDTAPAWRPDDELAAVPQDRQPWAPDVPAPARTPAHNTAPAPPMPRSESRRRGQQLRLAYLLLVPAFLLQAGPDPLAVASAVPAVTGIWFAVKGGSSGAGQRRSGTLAIFQATAIVPLLVHAVLALTALTHLR